MAPSVKPTKEKELSPAVNKPNQRFEISIVWENGEIALQAPTDPLIFQMVMGDALSGYAVQKAQENVAKAEGGQEKLESGPSLILSPGGSVPIQKTLFDKINQAKRDGRV